MATEQAPSIGIIIVNYNYAQFVSDAVESVISQDPPFEQIIVVDDGSTDNSLESIERYAGRVEVIAKKNGGQLSACLAGLSRLHTDYVYVLDADDFALPGLVKAAKAYCLSWPVKLQFQLVGVDAEKRPLDSVFPTYAPHYGSEAMISDNRVIGFYQCPATSGNIYRRDILNNLKFHLINMNDFIDGSPGLAVPYLGPVKSVNHPLACYRVHGINHSRWDQPDHRLLQGEIDRFHRRWQDVCQLLELPAPPFGNTEPLYVLERRLMQSALASGKGVTAQVLRYLRMLGQSCLDIKQKVMLAAWALALTVPVVSLRKKLVFAHRSPLNRSQTLRRIVKVLTGAGRYLRQGTAGA